MNSLAGFSMSPRYLPHDTRHKDSYYPSPHYSPVDVSLSPAQLTASPRRCDPTMFASIESVLPTSNDDISMSLLKLDDTDAVTSPSLSSPSLASSPLSGLSSIDSYNDRQYLLSDSDHAQLWSCMPPESYGTAPQYTTDLQQQLRRSSVPGNFYYHTTNINEHALLSATHQPLLCDSPITDNFNLPPGAAELNMVGAMHVPDAEIIDMSTATPDVMHRGMMPLMSNFTEPIPEPLSGLMDSRASSISGSDFTPSRTNSIASDCTNITGLMHEHIKPGEHAEVQTEIGGITVRMPQSVYVDLTQRTTLEPVLPALRRHSIATTAPGVEVTTRNRLTAPVQRAPSQDEMMTSFNARVAPGSNRRHRCHVCGKCFTRPSSLTSHSYSHTGEKPFSCKHDSCGRSFSVVSNLRRHEKIHLKRGSK
ncbi:uncharacterized protein V1518DRAFT_409086 [Limtongia smithiae]|uniref:uncharacterized protein n=1 Tax=Limtongia smithiae TaxID=1125753 RepID=UPI0034CD19D5